MQRVLKLRRVVLRVLSTLTKLLHLIGEVINATSLLREHCVAGTNAVLTHDNPLNVRAARNRRINLAALNTSGVVNVYAVRVLPVTSGAGDRGVRGDSRLSHTETMPGTSI